MKNKLKISIIALMLSATSAWAQKDAKVEVADSAIEDEFEFPDVMRNDADSVSTDWTSKMYLMPDSDCKMPDVNPYYEPKVYMERLSHLPTAIEMPYNSIVQHFIDQYTGRLRHSVSFMLAAQNFYVPIFEEALDLYQLPLELKWLPVIESALNPKAVSRVGAVGLWQFMLKTSKRYGLETNSLIDERCDPEKASLAAAKYLKDLYATYGDWNIVIAAYNCGPNEIRKAMRRAGGERDYWKIYPYLPRETRGYLPAFIAANYVMNYYCEHNICPMKVKVPTATDTLMISRALNLQQVAAICKLPVEELRTLNPQFRTDMVPGDVKPCALRLPQEVINTFIDAKDSVYNYHIDEAFTKRRTVEVDQDEVEKVDAQRSSRHSRSYSRRHRSSRSHSTRQRQRSKSVTVKDGQTLGELAEKHHTTVAKLRKLNGIKGSSIRAGKKLKVK